MDIFLEEKYVGIDTSGQLFVRLITLDWHQYLNLFVKPKLITGVSFDMDEKIPEKRETRACG